MKPIRYILIPAMLAAFMAAGCTKVNYGAPEDMPDSVSVSFKFDWQDQESPGEMYVVMSRIINTIHYGWMVAPDGTVTGYIPDYETDQEEGSGTDETPGDGSTDEETGDGGSDSGTEDTGTDEGSGNEGQANAQAEDTAGLPGMTVMNGEYYIMSFNQDIATAATSGLQDFLNNPAASMKNIRISAMPMPDEEIYGIYGGERTDFNPLYKFIKNISPVFIEVQQVNLTPELGADITLTPDRLTQEIKFRVNMEIEDGVTLEDITAEISGLAGSVEAMTGQIDNNETFRTIMKMEETSSEGNRKTYEGTVHAFGLFPSRDNTLITGPGILQITIKASDGTDTKIFHAGINIRQTITAAGMLEELENGKFRIASNQVTLEIPNTLKINKDQIAPGEDQGVEIWIDSDEILDAEI